VKKLLVVPAAFALAWLLTHGTAAQWRERSQRIPLPALSSALGPAPRPPAKELKVRELERLELGVSSDVIALAAHGDALYAGTFNDGVLEVRSGKRLAIDPRVNDLAVDDDGTVYAATAGGAYRDTRRLSAGSFAAVALWRGMPVFASRAGLSLANGDGFWTRGAPQGVHADGPAALADCGAFLCVGAGNGLWLFDGERTVRAAGELPEEMVTAVARGEGDDVWAGTMAGGIARLSRGGSFQPEVPDGRVAPHALLVQDGAILFGTPDGLVIVRGGETSLVRQLGPVTALATASRGGVWVGVRNAVVRIELGPQELAEARR
jgi:ligand-binding sensor domain-containing protein